MTLSPEDVSELLDSLEKEAKAIKQDLLKICWYMRGGITYSEAMMLSFDEREMIGKIIKENLEVTKESGLPFF